VSGKRYLAIDIGAESGRAAVGTFDGERIELAETHRFPNGPVRLPTTMFWDAPRLWQESLAGVAKTVREIGTPASIGIDTWGVDFAFLDNAGQLAGLPVCYRDARTEGILDAAFKVVPKEEIYSRTGLQFLRFNSLFQLYAMRKESPTDAFVGKKRLLFMPDLLNYFFCGTAAAEQTIASTSQMVDPRTGAWAKELIGRFGIPTDFLPDLCATGTVLGDLRAEVAAETGATGTKLVASAGHDTAAAVAAAPGKGDDWCYISSGTWSLMGAELSAPAISEAGLAANFTNEGGVAGTVRYLKNIMGLWLVQQCRRSFERKGQALDYDALAGMARLAAPFKSLVNPDDDRFTAPADMCETIAAYCKRTAQPVPEKPGEFARCCMESLALQYRRTLELMESTLGRGFRTIHVVGGGSKNELLCQMTADCCRRPVTAGPVEATAIGNCLIQATGLGDLNGLDDIREVVRRSYSPREYRPTESEAWDDAYARFVKLP
jgi:rhamnulokinase